MTSKEKAKELVDKFMPHSSGNSNNNEAKQCALITVDEILKDKEVVDGMRVINDPYWLEVKQEIEKL